MTKPFEFESPIGTLYVEAIPADISRRIPAMVSIYTPFHDGRTIPVRINRIDYDVRVMITAAEGAHHIWNVRRVGDGSYSTDAARPVILETCKQAREAFITARGEHAFIEAEIVDAERDLARIETWREELTNRIATLRSKL